MKSPFKLLFLFFLLITAVSGSVFGQNSQTATQLKVKQLIDKKAEYNRLTNSEIDGYRIKIHFGSDKDASRNIKTKFSAKFPEYNIHEDYQQPYFVILIGDFKSKLEAFETLKKIQPEFHDSFIVKGKIRAK